MNPATGNRSPARKEKFACILEEEQKDKEIEKDGGWRGEQQGLNIPTSGLATKGYRLSSGLRTASPGRFSTWV